MSKKSKKTKERKCPHHWAPMGTVYHDGKLCKKWQCIYCFKTRYGEKP